MPVIKEVKRQEDHEFEASLAYIASPCLKNKQNQREKLQKSCISFMIERLYALICNDSHVRIPE
jgi:hypothetical protein